MKGELNGSQARPGVESDQVEQRDASCDDIEIYGEEVIDPCYPMAIHGATTCEKWL